MDLGDDAVDEASKPGRDDRRLVVLSAWDDADPRVSQHLETEARKPLQRRELVGGLGAGNRLRREHVRADRPHEIAGVFEQRGVKVDMGCRAQRGAHLLSKTVDGRDRRRVEVHDGPLETIEPANAIGARQEAEQVVAGRDALRVAQPRSRLAEPGPDPVA